MRTKRLAFLLAAALPLVLTGHAFAAQFHKALMSAPDTELREDNSLVIEALPRGEPLDSASPAAKADAPPLTGIAAAIAARIGEGDAKQGARSRAAIAAFYKERGYQPVFVTDKGDFTPAAISIIERLRAAREDGFNPADYVRPSFATKPRTEQARADAEIELAGAALLYVRHAAIGRVDPAKISSLTTPRLREPDAVAVLNDLSAAADPVALLETYHPQTPAFRALRAALAEHQRDETPPRDVISANGPPIRLGMADPRVAQLRVRFALATSPDTGNDVMDAALLAAVRSFQEAKGMTASGTVDPNTIKALNGEANQRNQAKANIIANMERWRWLPRDLGNFHVWVNIPEFLVRVKQNDEIRYEGRVVVGKGETPTPVFSDQIQFLVVNPSWTVPPSIVKKELLPLYQKDPAAIAKKGLEVIRSKNGNITFRQPPGERNALGRIKFMFPNEHSVYLHDTPSKSFFAQTRRAYSHGCVRVDQPMKFADALLTREEGLNSRTLTAMYGKGERHVRLRQHIPVHLVYFTTIVGTDGKLVQYEDLYGFNARIKTALGLI